MTDILRRCTACGHLLADLRLCPWCNLEFCPYDLQKHKCTGKGRR